MSLHDGVVEVLATENGPLHSTVITERLLEHGLWSTQGKTPAATVAAHIYSDIKKNGAASPFRQVAKNTFEVTEAGAAAAGTPAQAEAVPAAAASADGPAPAGAAKPTAPGGPPSTGSVPAKKRLSFADAAEDVLKRHAQGKPMHYRDITKLVLAEALVKTGGKTPEATLYAQVVTEEARAQKKGATPRFVKHGKGMVGLTAWLQPGVQQEIAKHNAAAEKKMLAELRALNPADFEQLIGELLTALGLHEVEVTAYHGDKGIDATGVYELGPEMEVRLAVQAKRQQQNVQAPVVRELNGALKPNQQGLIITTSGFGPGARAEAARDDKPLIWLIDGKQLVQLLVANDIGAKRVAVELVEPTGFDLGSADAVSG